MSIGQGRIIKTYNGYYYVDSGTDELVTCKVKGKLKQIRFSLCTGDIVEFETNHNDYRQRRFDHRRICLYQPRFQLPAGR